MDDPRPLTDQDLAPIVFPAESLQPVEVEVNVGGRKLILREASEGDAVEWQNASSRAMRMTRDRAVHVGDLGELEPLLVHLCLYVPDPATGRVPMITVNNVSVPNRNARVPLAEVKGWLARVVGPLFERAKRISRLDQADTEEGLVKQIEELHQRLADLRERKAAAAEAGAAGADAKNPGGATAATSA